LKIFTNVICHCKFCCVCGGDARYARTGNSAK